MVKKLSFDSCGSLKRFPHTFTTDIPYRQDVNLGEDKGWLLGRKKDKYKVTYFLK